MWVFFIAIKIIIPLNAYKVITHVKTALNTSLYTKASMVFVGLFWIILFVGIAYLPGSS